MIRRLFTLAVVVGALQVVPPVAAESDHGMRFNPDARLDTTQVQDRRASGPLTTRIFDSGMFWTCTLDRDSAWHCIPAPASN